ncbi:MAG TPA: PilZ domain-containing protein [Thermoanaerobaculia bacterium]|nr:PilZ domain-containing protein [Thermoanaerobaculia bacterium]
MLSPDDLTFRRDELSAVLKLSPAVINALVATGALTTRRREGMDAIAAAEIERLFRDSLLRLYQAQAERAVRAKAVAEPEVEFDLDGPVAPITAEVEPAAAQLAEMAEADEMPVITRTSDEHLMTREELSADLRLGARYIPRRQIGGMFRNVKFTVVQLSNEGLRIKHAEKLNPGDEARLSFAIQNPPQSFVMKARVVWTSIAQRGDEPSFYVSGISVIGNTDHLAKAADLLRKSRDLQLDEKDTRRRLPMNMPRPVSGLPDDDVVAIIQAVRKFASDPAEATRWYTRARFSVTDEDVRRDAPRGARDRDEIVGIWEYLQRRIDLKAVAGVVQWIRRSSAAAV